jgi:hypothetical protein
MDNFPKIESVYTLPNYQLLVVFQNGTVKTYDCIPLLDEEVFMPLTSEALFNRVQVGAGGYGILWNDEIDLSESELWLNGEEARGLPVEVLFSRRSRSHE